MRIIHPLLISLLFSSVVFAEDIYLPESANPKTYTVISDCYAHDDVTFYTKQGRILGNYTDWKSIQIFKDGCFAKNNGKILYAGESFIHFDSTGNNPLYLSPNEKTFRVVPFGSGVVGVDKKYLYMGNYAYFLPKWIDVNHLQRLDGQYFHDGKFLYSFFASFDGILSQITGFDIPTLDVWIDPNGSSHLYDKNGFYIEKQNGNSLKNLKKTSVNEDYMRYAKFDTNTMVQTGIFLYDKYNIYLPLDFPKADISSFQVLPDYFSKDKDHIYSPTGKILSMIDVKSYEYIGNSIFRSHGKLYQWCQYEIGCDGYTLTGFDVTTFHKTIWGFADKNGNYDWYLRTISGKTLKEDIVPYDDFREYFHDTKNVYIQNWWWETYSILTGAIQSTFVTFSGNLYAKDSRSCWFEGARFSCNPRNFTTIEAWFAKDNKSVYYQTRKIPGADPKTFEKFTATWGYNWIETTHYSIDKNHVYYDDRVIKDANPRTFSLMKDLQSKDDKYIYYAGWKIQWADYGSYTPLHYSFARDKNHFYFAGIILNAINKPGDVKITNRDTLEYNGKVKNYWCFNNEVNSSMCN